MNHETLMAQGPVDVNVMRLAKSKRRDLLDLEYINSLPLPLWDGEWPVYDIDVETGLYRIDVCGLLDVRHIGRCFTMRDATGKNHYVSDLYLDPDEWEDRTAPETPNAEFSGATRLYRGASAGTPG